ncbi:MAG: PKD domain-containing protein, partial [Aquihabitans sp.]
MAEQIRSTRTKAARRGSPAGRAARGVASLLAFVLVVTIVPMRSDAWNPPDPTEWRKVDYELVTFRNDYLYQAPDSSGIMREHRGCEKVYLAVLDGADGLEGPGQYQPPADWRVRAGRKSIPGGGLFILGAITKWTRIDGTVVDRGIAPSGKPYVFFQITGRSIKGENTGNVKARCDRMDIEFTDAQAQAAIDDFELWTDVPNEMPYVSFEYAKSASTKREVQFTNHSTDTDGDPAAMRFTWEFGDGTRSNERDPKHTYA